MSRLTRMASVDRSAAAAGIVVPLATAAILVPFRVSFPNTDAALVLVAVVVAVAAFGSRVGGILAAVSAAAWFDFFLTKPYEQFTIMHRTDIETTVLLLAVGAAVTEIAVRARRDRVLLTIDETYLTAIRTTSEAVAAGAPTADVVEKCVEHLTALLGLRSCRFEQFRFGGLPRMESDGTLLWRDQAWDLETRGVPTAPIELLVTSGGRASGRFVIELDAEALPSRAACQVATVVAGQVGVSQASQPVGRW
jgi:hypothetical protein